MINVVKLIALIDVVEAISLRTIAIRSSIVCSLGLIMGVGGVLIWYFLNEGVGLKPCRRSFLGQLILCEVPTCFEQHN